MNSAASLLFGISEFSQMISTSLPTAALPKWLGAANGLVRLVEADPDSNDREKLSVKQMQRGVLQAISDHDDARHIETGAISIPLFNLHVAVKQRIDMK